MAIRKLKSLATTAPKFKKKRTDKQFDENSHVLDHIQSASSFLNSTPAQVEKALDELKEGEKKLPQRNKLNGIADSSEDGWEAVNERPPFADDSDDNKRQRRAETRASQNIGVYPLRRVQLFSIASRRPSVVFLLFLSIYQEPLLTSQPTKVGCPFLRAIIFPSIAVSEEVPVFLVGHFRSQCPVLTVQSSSSQPNKRV